MTRTIALLGAGVMGEALLSGILKSGHPSDNIVVSEPRELRREELRNSYGVTVTDDARSAVEGASVVLIAVKPQDMAGLLGDISPYVRSGSAVVSLAAGFTLASMAHSLPDDVGAVRAMPNTPALIGEGMFGVSVGPGCDSGQQTAVVDILKTCGRVLVVDESDQDALTAVSGSGPAYVFYLAEAMIAGGVRAGLDQSTALELTLQTIWGAAGLINLHGAEPGELRSRVTSPNGTTAAAIAMFDDRLVLDAIADGVVAAASRSAELAGQ